MKQQPEQSARIVGTAVFAVETVRQHERLQMRRLEPAIEEFAETAGRERDEIADLPALQSAKLESKAQQLSRAGKAGALQVRWRLHEERFEMTRQLAQMT